MTHAEKRVYLIKALLREDPRYREISIPADPGAQEYLLRSLLNVRPPRAASRTFLQVQGAYLAEILAKKGITDSDTLPQLRPGISLWQGDITTLRADGIVNAANSSLLGCFIPCHGCIDNAIHTFAGVELRLACERLIQQQGREEGVGQAKITLAFHLPSRYVLHTVGPIVTGRLHQNACEELASCYRACLTLADAYRLRSLALCCISTGEFHFPPEQAARIALTSVTNYQRQTHTDMKVIFNVFRQTDYQLYRDLLRADGSAAPVALCDDDESAL